MAQKTVVMLEDDLDGGEADETVSFALDGSAYEIDLNADNAARLRDALAPWIGAARRAGRGGGAPRRGATATRASRASAGGDRNAEIRAWAKEQGLKVSERGRLSADVVERYEAAHR